MLILGEVRKGPVTPRRKPPQCFDCAPLPVVRRVPDWPANWECHFR
jgi:hypothetical protein